MNRNTIRALKKRKSAFEHEFLFCTDAKALDIQSVFIEKNGKKNEVVVRCKHSDNFDQTEKLVKDFFYPYEAKLLVANSEPIATGLLHSGRGVRHSTTPGWGTLGGFFRVRNNSNLYGLSNNHVISNMKMGNFGDAVHYSEGRAIAGKLVRKIPLKPLPQKNFMDAALFQVSDVHTGKWVPRKPSNPWIGPRLNMKVYKNGYGTGLTRGKITGYNGAAKVKLNGKVFAFSGIIAIKAFSGHFNKPGDSGSIVLSSSGNHMVGLVFAKHGAYCWALPISKIKPLLG